MYSSYSKFIIYINYHPYFIIFLTNNFFLILISTTIHYFILIYIIIIFYFSLCNNNKQNKIRESEFLKINKIIPFYFLFSFSLPYFLSFLFFSSFLSLPIASPSTRLSLSLGRRRVAAQGSQRRSEVAPARGAPGETALAWLRRRVGRDGAKLPSWRKRWSGGGRRRGGSRRPTAARARGDGGELPPSSSWRERSSSLPKRSIADRRNPLRLPNSCSICNHPIPLTGRCCRRFSHSKHYT
jgi:hypothetical protein